MNSTTLISGTEFRCGNVYIDDITPKWYFSMYLYFYKLLLFRYLGCVRSTLPETSPVGAAVPMFVDARPLGRYHPITMYDTTTQQRGCGFGCDDRQDLCLMRGTETPRGGSGVYVNDIYGTISHNSQCQDTNG